jgi:phospholipid transport system substrate-binding protein
MCNGYSQKMTCNNIQSFLIKYFVCFISFSLFLLTSHAIDASSKNARVALQTTLEEIMAILQSEEFKAPDKKMVRRNAMLYVLEYRFDFEEMAKRSLAKEWKKRTPVEREQFVMIFGQLIENSYISKIESYSDEEILFFGEKKKKNKVLVETTVRRNNTDFSVSYKLLDKNGRWKVYDVIIEGVSLVRNYRSQFKNFLGKQSYADLVKRLESKVEKLILENT